ncbi:hypothetical protein [Agilicoccus flavus]|nr:hypothetical protein [Agilicoccus flavus]
MTDPGAPDNNVTDGTDDGTDPDHEQTPAAAGGLDDEAPEQGEGETNSY